MGILDFFRKKSVLQDNHDEKVIDLSDSKQYPASVLADLNCVFALGDDSENFLHFIQNICDSSFIIFGKIQPFEVQISTP